ncbi:alkaline phosphatase D family protein [Nocardia altamirensis]|uniref:alkaline phosphatase D family protein n=1 Tax=Nocardia altamirensis TaxID=472158 RepID=UPI00084035A2|nr:alkaline phosphatase D family protein [Nocardia altamirensis]
MTSSVPRRSFFAGLAVAGGMLALPASGFAAPILRQAPDGAADLIGNPLFGTGVMAGVPRTDGATLWTRVSGGSAGSAGKLAVVVSRRDDLSSPELTETATTGADGTVHFEAAGLRPGEQYFYQFRGRGTESAVGRFKTLRPADSNEPVKIGWFACQAFEEGYYAAHRHLAAEDLDLVICLGDYIYEFTKPGVRGVEVNAYPQLLEQMREKYRKYRSDTDLQLMHSRHAFVPMWDDHEYRNNYWKEGWTGFGADKVEGAVGFEQKKQWAWQAWFEHMPVPRFPGAPNRTHRSLRLGKTVELWVQDDRQYRDAQPCGDASGVCSAADAGGRSMLGDNQTRWLLDGMSGSDATWKVMGNAVMMMGMVTGDDGRRAFMDSWDGYGAERTHILSTAAAQIKNMVLVTGDDHNGYAGELWDTGFAPGTVTGTQVNPPGTTRAAVEYLVPSVTSTNAGDGGYLPTDAGDPVVAAHNEEAARHARNPHAKYINMVDHGYGVLEVASNEARFHFRSVDKLDPNAGVTTRSFRTPSGQSIIEAL